jgi:hypothetical protein
MKTLRTLLLLSLQRTAVALCVGVLLPLLAAAQYTGGQGRGDVMVGFNPPALVVNTITLDFEPTGLCTDDIPFNAPYTGTGTFGPGNTFTLELSDANGSFASPVVVGTLVSNSTSGSISGAIPGNTPFGNQYRLRITSSVPAVTSAPNATDIIMLQLVNWYADVDGDGLGDPDDFVFACIPPDPSYVNSGDDPCPLAVDAIANFNPATCGCDLGYFATITDIGGNDVVTACTICPPGSYCPDGLVAVPCAAGSFNSTQGATQCQPCLAGTFSGTVGATLCTSCPAGSFSSVTGAIECTSCAAGTFSSTVGSTFCTSCPAGSFSDVTGSVVCTLCPAGSFNNLLGSTSCESCPAGTFSGTVGSVICTSCPAGTFSDVTGSVVCTLCPAGSFNNLIGSTSCESCPAGTFSAVTGSIACAPCAAGFANGSTGQTGCAACPPGSFSANAGQATCALCPAGTFNPLSAQTECQACPSGETSGVGATECLPDGPCTDYILEFQTDAAPFETTWEIRNEGNNDLVQSGGPLAAPNDVQTIQTCLPDGCYTFFVFDAGGDGMTTGGYILRTQGTNQRIIDNRNNFSTGSISAISGGQGFCLPISNQRVIFTSCDKLDWTNGQYVVASADPAVSAEWIVGGANSVQDNNSGYEFWIFDPNGSYSFRRFRSHNVSDGYANVGATRACHMKLNNWAVASQVPANVLMNVRVRPRVNGVNGEFGPACRLMIDPVRAACPLTKLMDVPGNQYFSCGVTRQWGPSTSVIAARPVSGANRYQFRFRLPAEGFEVVITRTT